MAPVNAVPLSETLSVAGQISPADLRAIATAGVKSIVCNRPGGESSGQFSPQDGREFGDLVNQLLGPVLAYCRSGMRSATLWALSQAGSNLSCVAPPTTAFL
jgi:sulfide:quinone oxidoreductase